MESSDVLTCEFLNNNHTGMIWAIIYLTVPSLSDHTRVVRKATPTIFVPELNPIILTILPELNCCILSSTAALSKLLAKLSDLLSG